MFMALPNVCADPWPLSVLDATSELLLGLNEAVSVDVLESWVPLEKRELRSSPCPC